MDNKYQENLDQEPAPQSLGEKWATRGLAIAGVAAILVVVVWAIIKTVGYAPDLLTGLQNSGGSVSSLFFPAKAEQIIVAPESLNVQSGQPFNLSWKHENAGTVTGTYAVSFSCHEGLTGQAANKDGEFMPAFCNTPFNFSGDGSSMRLMFTATSVGQNIDVPVTVAFIPDGAEQPSVQGSVTIQVLNQPAQQNTSGQNTDVSHTGTSTKPTTVVTHPTATSTVASGTGTSTKPTTSHTGTTHTTTHTTSTGTGTTTPALYGLSDLLVKNVRVGYLNATTGEFVQTNVLKLGMRIAVRFAIENIGTNKTGSWFFQATLPNGTNNVLRSNLEPSLNPGDGVEFTLSYDQIGPAKQPSVITIVADPSQQLHETSESNNTTTITLPIN